MTQQHGSSHAPRRAVRSDDVVKKRYSGKPAVVTLKMEADFLQRIDDEVLFQSNQKGRILTRSDVVKDLIHDALTARTKKRTK